MEKDDEGFRHPVVMYEECVGCGLCYKKCPVLHAPTNQTGYEQKVFAAFNRDKNIQENSTSGGIYTELARTVLENGGCVAAVVYNQQHLPEHKLIYKESELEGTRQSKYVQSKTGNIYFKVKTQLEMGKKVLFVGTPCQCAAMKNYVGKDINNIYLCDFICRGVNSEDAYQAYLESVRRKNGGKEIKKVWFKNKTFGWNCFSTKIVFEDDSFYLQDREHDSFMKGYIKKNLNLYMRPSCGDCSFKGTERVSDITLGDFWGIDIAEMPEEAQNGVSCVVVNTSKGMQLWGAIKDNVYMWEHHMDDIIPYNRCVIESALPGEKRKEFFAELHQGKDFIELMEGF